MARSVRRVDSKEDGCWRSEVAKAKGKEALRDMLPLLETYLNNPTKFCWERLHNFCSFHAEALDCADIGDDAAEVWHTILYPTNFEKDQGMIYLRIVMLKESILNVLKPERNR